MRTCWRNLFVLAVEETGDPIIKCTLSVDEQLEQFDAWGHGSAQGKPFTAWGRKYVYFPVQHDGQEWVGWAPRNPCDEPTEHQGDG